MPAVYILLTMTVFWRLWTPIHDAERSWKYDPPNEYWGDLIFQQDTLAEGQLAAWNPHDRGGFPVYGDPQPGLLYPANWPLLIWGSFGEALDFGIASFKIVAHWIFGAIGMHLLIRRFGAREPACYTAGILFAFTSPKLRYMGSALNWSVAWIPWVLLAVKWFAEKPDPKRAVVMGSSLAMVLLSGAPAVVLYTLILALPFGLYLMRGRLLENWKPIAISAGVTLLWILPLMASNLEQLPESVRQVRTYSFITDSVFSPGHLLSYIVPRLGQGENPYIGALAILGIGLAIASKKHRALAWLFLGVAAFSIAIALGGHAGFLPALASAFSPFSMFRRAHRYLYITSVALAIIAGLGFAHLISLEVEERKAQLAKYLTWVGGALTFALGVAYLVAVVMEEKINAPKPVGFGLAFLSAAVFTVLLRQILRSGPKARTLLIWSIPALVFFDVWTANFQVSDIGMEGLPLTPKDDKLALLEGVERDWRIYDNDFFKYRPGTRMGIRDFSGYEDDPLGLSRYTSLLTASKRNISLMGHANVRYFLAGSGRLKIRAKDGKQIHPGIWELNDSAPAVYYVPAPITAQDPAESLQALRGFKPGTAAVVEGSVSPGAAELPITSGRITLLEPNHMKAEIDTPGPGLIIIAEAYYPKWTATLDGKSTEVLPANLMFRGIPVSSAGHHKIEMQLRPGRFFYLLPAYLLALLLLLWAAFAPRRE
jgi:hypothetical protein